eukprot:gene10994-biopygen13893
MLGTLADNFEGPPASKSSLVWSTRCPQKNGIFGSLGSIPLGPRLLETRVLGSSGGKCTQGLVSGGRHLELRFPLRESPTNLIPNRTEYPHQPLCTFATTCLQNSCFEQPVGSKVCYRANQKYSFCGHRVDQTRDDFDAGGHSKLSARVRNMTPGPRPGTPHVPEMLENSTPAGVREGPDARPQFPKRGMQWALGAGKPPDHFPKPPCEEGHATCRTKNTYFSVSHRTYSTM